VVAARCLEPACDLKRRDELELTTGAESTDAERKAFRLDFVRRFHRKLRSE
jgi:hypothetical protein